MCTSSVRQRKMEIPGMINRGQDGKTEILAE